MLKKAKLRQVVTLLARSFESHLQYRNLTPEKLNEMNHYFAMKLVDWKKDRYTIFEVVESDPASKTFYMRARNNFESFSNCNRPLTETRTRRCTRPATSSQSSTPSANCSAPSTTRWTVRRKE